MGSLGEFTGRVCEETWKLISSGKKTFSQITMVLVLVSVARTVLGLVFSESLVGFDMVSVITPIRDAACIYIISCIYNGQEDLVTVKKVMSFELWWRVYKTVLCSFLVFSAYVAVAKPFVIAYTKILDPETFATSSTSPPQLWTCLGIANLAFRGTSLYVKVVLELAVVVSVLEERTCGLGALRKSRQLLKRKGEGVLLAMFTWILWRGGRELVGDYTGYISSSSLALQVSFWVTSIIFVNFLRLFGFLVLTILYFCLREKDAACNEDHVVNDS